MYRMVNIWPFILSRMPRFSCLGKITLFVVNRKQLILTEDTGYTYSHVYLNINILTWWSECLYMYILVGKCTEW